MASIHNRVNIDPDRIYSLTRKNGTTLGKLAVQIGIMPPSLSRIMRSGKMQLPMAQRAAKVLGVKVVDLAGGMHGND